MLEWLDQPHRRLNILSGEWVLVSPQRLQRPWQGEVERTESTTAVTYDPSCYLCPGNRRAGHASNPPYTSTFVFDNDFPAMLPDAGPGALNERGILVATAESGICRVMCFTPRHDLAIPSLDTEALREVVNTWSTEAVALRNRPSINYVQIFENRGAQMGASNPHPHCQIWAVEHVPNEVVKEDLNQRKHWQDRGSCLLCDYVGLEGRGERVVCENESFLAVVPFWAVWPFETIVLSKRHIGRLEEATNVEKLHLGTMLRNVTRRYDGLFAGPFPYSMGLHERPNTSVKDASAVWHFHAHFYPPLLRSATVRKFMVGFELLAGPQRDISPEMAALRMRTVLTQTDLE